jgi:hypothetical protein
MGRWRYEHRDESIVLIHDRSSNMASLEHVWDFFMAKDRRPFEREWGDRSTVYPIAVERTLFEDSENWAGLQLADVVAGAYTDVAGRVAAGDNFEDDCGNELWHGVLMDSDMDLPIWPTLKFTPEEMGTAGSDPNEALKYITAEMERAGSDPRRLRQRGGG